MNEKVVRQLFIENSGKFNIDFSWELTQPQKPKGMKDAWPKDNPPVSIVPDSGNVQSNTRRRCQLSFCPPRSMVLEGCHLILKVGAFVAHVLAVSEAGKALLPTVSIAL